MHIVEKDLKKSKSPMAPKEEHENDIEKIASFIASTKISEEKSLLIQSKETSSSRLP